MNYAEYYRENRERELERGREYREFYPIRYIYKTAKKRAKQKGIEFTIKLSDLPVDLPKKCPWLGIPLIPATKMWNDNSPSLDRLDNSRGYVPGNVIIISLRANHIKSNATANEILRVGRGIKRALQKNKEKL